MKMLLATVLLAGTPALGQATEPVIAGTRLDISATGSVDRTPDLATIGAGVVTQASSAGAAMANNAKAMAATITALKRSGIADRDIQTASLSLQPQYRFGQDQAQTLTGYQASNRVTVRLRDLSRAGTVIDGLIAAGANQIDGPTFAVEKPDSALDEARTRALAAARTRAELYAKAAGLHVKRIVRISESEQQNFTPPGIVAFASKRDATPVAPGEQTLSVTLAVTFELD